MEKLKCGKKVTIAIIVPFQIDAIKKEMEPMVEGMEKWKKMTAIKFEDDAASKQKESYQEVAEDIMNSEKPLSTAFSDDLYPCMVAMLGSAFAFMRVCMFAIKYLYKYVYKYVLISQLQQAQLPVQTPTHGRALKSIHPVCILRTVAEYSID